MPTQQNITGLRVVKNGQKSEILNLSNARRKTYAELQQLSDAQKKGVIICPDYPLDDGDLIPATAVKYGNTTVDAKLTELNADITDVSIPVNINKIKIYKKLGITQVILTGLDYTTASSFTVPDGYRPRSTLTVVGSNYTGSALDIVLVTIETNGDIIVQNNTGAVVTNYTAVTCSFNYIS